MRNRIRVLMVVGLVAGLLVVPQSVLGDEGTDPTPAGSTETAKDSSFFGAVFDTLRDAFSALARGEMPNAPGLAVARTKVPENNHARGLVFDGLEPGVGRCLGLFQAHLADGTVVCTHGPDVAPRGLDVRNPDPVIAAETAGEGTGGTSTGTVACIGNGVDGNRVQAIYVVPADRPDRYAEVEPQIHGWAAEIERVFNDSAAQVSGERHVRFVTNPDCSLDVAYAQVSSAGDDNIVNTINELKALGFNDPSRKYLVWMDAAVYCGVGQMYVDDKPTADNLHNGGRTMFARIDAACWGRTSSVEAHELMHTMGGVQPSAPHASVNYHCTDEYDRMCYQDGVDVVMTYECASTNEQYLDCNHDDYYHPNPPAGSYLATHWNVANSSFLDGPEVGDPPINEAPTADAGTDQTVEYPADAQLDGVATDDGMPDGTLTSAWSMVSGPGAVTFADSTSPVTTAEFSAAGTYVLLLTVDDGELASSDTVTVICTEPATGPVNQAPTVEAGPNRSVDITDIADLAGSVDDDGLPSGSVSITWTKASGPGIVTFADEASPTTTATFSAAGTYVLHLLADDSELSSSDAVTISVSEPAGPTETTSTFESNLNKRHRTRSFVVNTAGGEISATLEAVVSSKGKKAKTPPELTLTVSDADGEILGEALSPADWSALALPAGQYTFEVGGSTRASFVLNITYWS